MDILNHYHITDLIASSGQPTSEQFREIAGQGYGVIINLVMPEHKQSICTEGSLVTTLAMTFLQSPMPFDAPSENQYREFTDYMDALKYRKVWVHCIVNACVSAFFFSLPAGSSRILCPEAGVASAKGMDARDGRSLERVH